MKDSKTLLLLYIKYIRKLVILLEDNGFYFNKLVRLKVLTLLRFYLQDNNFEYSFKNEWYRFN